MAVEFFSQGFNRNIYICVKPLYFGENIYENGFLPGRDNWKIRLQKTGNICTATPDRVCRTGGVQGNSAMQVGLSCNNYCNNGKGNDTTLEKCSNAKFWETPRCKGKILRTHKVKLWQANEQALIWPLTTVFETVFLRTTTHQRAIEKLTLKWKWNSHFIQVTRWDFSYKTDSKVI